MCKRDPRDGDARQHAAAVEPCSGSAIEVAGHCVCIGLVHIRHEMFRAARERTERATREVDSPSSLQSGVSSRTSQRRPAASGRAALRKEVSVLADRPRKRANPDEIAVDLHALSNSSCSAGTYDEPCAFRNRGGVPSITEKCPRQPRVIFGVRVDSRVPVVGARASVPSSETWYEFRLRRWSQRKRRPTNSARSG